MRGDWQRSQVLEYLFEPATSEAERQERRQEKAEVEAAVNLIPPEWKEMASGRYTRPRLINRRLEEAKGEEEYRFDNMGDMFIVEFPSGVVGNEIGLAYITHYAGFGALHFVLLINNGGNTEMYAQKGKLVPNASGREWRFYQISGRPALHANVPRAAAAAPVPGAAAAAAAYPAAVGANPPANIAGANVEEEDPKNPNNNNSNAHRGGRRKRMKKGKSKKTTRKQKKHTRKHTRKH
jgi:hypothetical protein